MYFPALSFRHTWVCNVKPGEHEGVRLVLRVRRDGFYLRTLTISLQLTDPSFLTVTQGQECLSQNGNVTGFLGQTDYYTASISAMEPTGPGYCHRLLSLLPQSSLLSSTTRLDTSNTIKRSPSFPLSLGALKAHHTQGKPETWCGLRSSEKEDFVSCFIWSCQKLSPRSGKVTQVFLRKNTTSGPCVNTQSHSTLQSTRKAPLCWN